jgi:hypothetical protein
MMQKHAVLPAVLAAMLLSGMAVAQQPSVNSALLDHLAGNWVLRGTIAGQQTTHDVNAEWVLGHHYLRINEVSREKSSSGQPQYEATVFVGWNAKAKQYACVWLDVLGGMSAESIGVATPRENVIPFVFTDEQGEVMFRNDFVYDPKTNSWEWRMENVKKGVSKPFGRVTLTRK